MRMPIRGIQVILIGAFFLHLIGWSFDLANYYADEHLRLISGRTSLAFWSVKLPDLAYAAIYLGEAALIELLMRIWFSKGEQQRPPP